MHKYFLVAKNTWDETLTYRLNFVMWRVRTNISLLAFYFLWFAVIPKDGSAFGYSHSTILTYILGTAIVSAIVLSARTHVIGDEINKGDLSNYLLKPINYFLYWLSKNFGDKAMNIMLSMVELSILYIVLKPPVFIQKDLIFILFFVISIILAIFLHFLIDVLLGFIGFWSAEIWAPRFIFFASIGFFSGVYFPLDILPKGVFQIFSILPFSYLMYFPLKIYLGELSILKILEGLLITGIWIFILFLITKFVWKKGLQAYTAYGR